MADDNNSGMDLEGNHSTYQVADENAGLTFDKLLETMREFEKTQLDDIIGMTFNPPAWSTLRAKYPTVDFNIGVNINGIPCYQLMKQTEDCIGWRSKQMMELWIQADGSEFIDELPELKSKGSA